VPDQAEVRTINCQTSDTKLLESIDAYRQSLLISVGIDGYDNDTTNTCVVTSNNGTVCSPNDLKRSQKLFSFGADLDYLQRTTGDGSKWISDSTEKIIMYSISLKQDLFVSYDLKGDMQKVELGLMEKNPETYFNFFNKYGTHFIASALMGGKIRLLSTIDKSFTTDSSDLNITGSITISKEEATRAANEKFQSTLNGHIGFGLENMATVSSFAQTNDWDIFGGDVAQVNLLNVNIAPQEMNNWKKTLPQNPIAGSFRLEPIEYLFDDPSVRDQIAAARAVFLTYDTDFIVALKNDDLAQKK